MQTPLRKARHEANRTLVDLAAEAEITPASLSRIERGEQKASTDVAERLSRSLGGRVSEMEILYPERYAEQGNSDQRSGAAA